MCEWKYFKSPPPPLPCVACCVKSLSALSGVPYQDGLLHFITFFTAGSSEVKTNKYEKTKRQFYVNSK